MALVEADVAVLTMMTVLKDDVGYFGVVLLTDSD